jgi:hypothetical protein
MRSRSNQEVWDLAERLMVSIIGRLRRIDELAPGFPDELYEARDTTMEGLQVVDYIERFARHSQQHRHHLASIRAAIGRSRPTEPGSDADPITGESHADIWYQWLLLEALVKRAELVSELVGLNDEDLNRKPDPGLTAGSTKTVREVCEHVLAVEDWKMRGIEDALHHYRKANVTEEPELKRRTR